jgi:hypothetical protein
VGHHRHAQLHHGALWPFTHVTSRSLLFEAVKKLVTTVYGRKSMLVGIPADHDSDLFALDDALDVPIIGTHATLCHTVVLPILRSGPAT